MENVETVKEFLEDLKENDTKVLNYADLLSELKNTHEMTFTGSLKTNMLTPKKGLISIDMFLDNLITFKEQGYFLSNSEIKELENDTSNYTHDNEWYTYNDDGNYLAHDINMNIFINDEGNYLVFLQVHTGADARWGFSSYIALKFDTKMDYEDAFTYDTTEYTLASCTLKTQEGATLYTTVSSAPFNYLAILYVMDNDTFEEIFTTEIGCVDLDTIKDVVNDYISSDKELSKKYHIKEFTDYNGIVEAI